MERRLSKQEAHYLPLGLPFRQCFQCKYFMEEYRENNCEKVMGTVRFEGGCAVFQPKINKEFFKKIAEKQGA